MSRLTSRGPAHIDKGWAWVVAIAIFFERFFTVGVTRSSGLFLLRLVDRYHVSTTYAGTALSLALSIFAVGAPVATVLGESLTPRRLFIFGGLFSVGTLAVSGLVVHLPLIIVMMGLGIGVVNSCSYGNGMVMVGKYFRVRRQMATNIALLGGSVGQLVLPPVIEYFITFYGLSGALMLSGALYLQCAVAGALLRPIDLSYQRVGDDHEIEGNVFDDRVDDKNEGPAVDDDNCCAEVFGAAKIDGARYYKKLKSEKIPKNADVRDSQADLQERATHISASQEAVPSSTEDQIPPNNFIIPEIFIQNDKDELFPLPKTDDWRNELYGGNRVNSRLTVESTRRKSEESAGKTSLKNGRRASFTGSTDNVIFASKSSSLSASRTELYSSDEFDDGDDHEGSSDGSDGGRRRRSSSIHIIQKQSTSTSKSTPKWKSFARLVFDFSVLKNGVTVLFIFITFSFYFVWYNFVFLIPGIVLEKGVTGFDRPVLISLIGLGELTARVVVTIRYICCGDNSIIRLEKYKLKATAAFLGGVSVVLFIPASSFPQLAVYSFLHGLFGGVFECLLPGVLTDFVGVAMMAKTLGVVLLFQGMGGAIGQPLLGCVKDLTGSHLVTCAICSAFLLVSSFLLLVHPLVRGKS